MRPFIYNAKRIQVLSLIYQGPKKLQERQTKTRLCGGLSGLILEVSSGRLILAPAVIAAKIALRSRTRAEGKLGDCCAAISTGPISFYHGSLKPSLVVLFHSIFEVQLDFKRILMCLLLPTHIISYGRELYSDSSTKISIHSFSRLVNPSLS